MNKYKKMWLEATELKEKFLSECWLHECTSRDAINTAKEAIALAEDIQKENKNLRAECSKVISELSDELANCKKQHDDTLRLLDSYMQTNARQAQDIIELESVAVALYNVLWHQVHSVEYELKESGCDVTELNAYKTIRALFESEGEADG